MGIKDAQRFDADVKGRAVIQLFHYFDRTFFDLWPDDMKKLLLSVADFPSFDRELADAASLLPNVSRISVGRGVEDDEELVSLIMKQEQICWAAAGFTLAAFLVEYADFMAEDDSYYEIVN
jgi:hypothetical protein